MKGNEDCPAITFYCVIHGRYWFWVNKMMTSLLGELFLLMVYKKLKTLKIKKRSIRYSKKAIARFSYQCPQVTHELSFKVKRGIQWPAAVG